MILGAPLPHYNYLCQKPKTLRKASVTDGAKLWNSLPADMRDSDTLSTFINAVDARNF